MHEIHINPGHLIYISMEKENVGEQHYQMESNQIKLMTVGSLFSTLNGVHKSKHVSNRLADYICATLNLHDDEVY